MLKDVLLDFTRFEDSLDIEGSPKHGKLAFLQRLFRLNGFILPILYKDGKITDGKKRLKILSLLKITHAFCIDEDELTASSYRDYQDLRMFIDLRDALNWKYQAVGFYRFHQMCVASFGAAQRGRGHTEGWGYKQSAAFFEKSTGYVFGQCSMGKYFCDNPGSIRTMENRRTVLKMVTAHTREQREAEQERAIFDGLDKIS